MSGVKCKTLFLTVPIYNFEADNLYWKIDIHYIIISISETDN